MISLEILKSYYKSPSNIKVKQYLKKYFGFSTYKVSLYQLAFRHKSAAKEITGGIKNSNERLEYLGDSILDAVIADYLYNQFPYKDEGFLTLMRSKIVSRQYLNQLAIKLGIEELIETNAEDDQKNKSIHGNTFEALIGAIYLDKGFIFTKKLILNRILKEHVNIDELEKTDNDYKSTLVRWGQEKKRTIQFKLVKELGPQHEKQFIIQVLINNEVKGRGQGFTKREAEQIAAEEALKYSNSLDK